MKAGLRALVILVYCVGSFVLFLIDLVLTITAFMGAATSIVDVIKGILGLIIFLVLISLSVCIGFLIWPDRETKKFLKVWRNIFFQRS